MKRKNKFKARKTNCSVKHPHPSALEASVCDILGMRERAGEITDIKWISTVHFPFGIKWKVDFSFLDIAAGETKWAEAKGVSTADYLLKLKMWRNGAGPGKLEIWKGTHKRPILIETVVPCP